MSIFQIHDYLKYITRFFIGNQFVLLFFMNLTKFCAYNKNYNKNYIDSDFKFQRDKI